MYYISYAISALVVLDLYSESTYDYDRVVDKYMRISAEGIYRTYSEIVEECQLPDIFDKTVMAEIAGKTEDAF